MGAAILTFTAEQTSIECCTCSVLFSMPSSMYRHKRANKGETFYCPAGHPQSFTGPTEADKLRAELEQKQRELKWAAEAKDRALQRAAAAERVASAARGQVTKIRNRVGNGVCPCCNRSFTNLQRHMATKHAGFAHADAAPDGSVKQ